MANHGGVHTILSQCRKSEAELIGFGLFSPNRKRYLFGDEVTVKVEMGVLILCRQKRSLENIVLRRGLDGFALMIRSIACLWSLYICRASLSMSLVDGLGHGLADEVEAGDLGDPVGGAIEFTPGE